MTARSPGGLVTLVDVAKGRGHRQYDGIPPNLRRKKPRYFSPNKWPLQSWQALLAYFAIDYCYRSQRGLQHTSNLPNFQLNKKNENSIVISPQHVCLLYFSENLDFRHEVECKTRVLMIVETYRLTRTQRALRTSKERDAYPFLFPES